VTKRNENLDALSQLDADEVLAVRENLESARKIPDGPKARCVPESLCIEIDGLLRLIELAVRYKQRS